jgi:hypothetical protein
MGVIVSPVCLFCGRGMDQIELLPAELLAQPGIFACTDHIRTDGWQNWPHTQAPFDLGYPSNPTID